MSFVKVIEPEPNEPTSAEDIENIQIVEEAQPEPVAAQLPAPTNQSPESQQERQSLLHKFKFWLKRVHRQRDQSDHANEEIQRIRLLHNRFLISVHMHAIGYLIFAIMQWVLLYKIKALALFSKMHNDLALIPFVLSYFMLMCLVFFYDNLSNSKGGVFFYLYTIIVLQLATIPIAMPFSTCNLMQFIISTILSGTVITISILLAAFRGDLYYHKPQFIIAWTFRCLLIASICIIVGTSLSPKFNIVMTMIMCFFMSIFIIICGRAISRAEFICLDKYCSHFYGTLFYLNYITLYSMYLLLLEQLHEVSNL